MNAPKIVYYKDAIKKVRLGNHKGQVILAKPVFILAIIEITEKGKIENKFTYDDLLDDYRKLYKQHLGNAITPMYKPFYFLHNDGFWHLNFFAFPIEPKSVRQLRDNIEYAYLDNALWDLLQDKDVREELREDIIKFFMLHPQNL